MNSNLIGRYLMAVGVFILAFVLFFWLFNFVNFIHETGHMVFGFGGGIIKGEITHFTISSWVKEPFTQLNLLPQQTRITNGTGSLNFALGGPMFVIIIFLGLSWLGYRLSGQKRWFLLFLSLAMYEISGNIVCGTDNFLGTPLSFCNHSIDKYILLSAWLLFAVFMAFMTTQRIVKK